MKTQKVPGIISCSCNHLTPFLKCLLMGLLVKEKTSFSNEKFHLYIILSFCGFQCTYTLYDLSARYHQINNNSWKLVNGLFVWQHTSASHPTAKTIDQLLRILKLVTMKMSFHVIKPRKTKLTKIFCTINKPETSIDTILALYIS